MELFTQEQREKLLENGRANSGRAEPHDFMPVVRLLARWSREIWLLTEIDPDHPDLGYGLYDSGRGLPVLGPIDLAPLYALSGPPGEHVLRDDSFQPTRRLSTYARLAHIVPRTKM
jgi:hypothetical protein